MQECLKTPMSPLPKEFQDLSPVYLGSDAKVSSGSVLSPSKPGHPPFVQKLLGSKVSMKSPTELMEGKDIPTGSLSSPLEGKGTFTFDWFY